MKRAFLQTLVFCLLLPAIAPVRADVISMDAVLAAEQHAVDVHRVTELLDRDAVRQSLIRMGVDPDAAISRVEALSPAELQLLAERLETAPAGGFVEVIGIVAIVLIILELIGVTNAFTNF